MLVCLRNNLFPTTMPTTMPAIPNTSEVKEPVTPERKSQRQFHSTPYNHTSASVGTHINNVTLVCSCTDPLLFHMLFILLMFVLPTVVTS